MKAVLMPFGYFVSGPSECTFCETMEEAEAWISDSDSFDRDDYTVTELFAKGWKGKLLEHEGSRNWDKDFAKQILRGEE